MALRRGFTRYAFSIQYHGSSFLGFPYLSDQENAVIEHKQSNRNHRYTHTTDLRGYRSIESRLRQALKDMVGNSTFENIQVSSRTDRGVHALKNTCQVDIGHRQSSTTKGGDEPTIAWQPEVLLRGLNHHLSQQGVDEDTVCENHNRHSNTPSRLSNKERRIQQRAKRKVDSWSFHYPMNELRFLNILQAPLTIQNDYHTIDSSQPATVDWNIRFSAKQRTYIYRILACPRDVADWALPFEWDRSWRVVPLKNNKQSAVTVLDVDAMAQAAKHFLGTHDFSSFRAAGCQRKVPVVTMRDLQIRAQPYGEPLLWEASGGLLGLGGGDDDNGNHKPQLITIKIVGNSFVYNQVRNMVGALVAVGRGSLEPLDIKRILEAKDRTLAPPLAPAHGLFLADVRHDDITL